MEVGSLPRSPKCWNSNLQIIPKRSPLFQLVKDLRTLPAWVIVCVFSPAIAILHYTTSADNSYLTSYPQPSRPPWYLHQDTPSSFHQGHNYNNYMDQTKPSKPLFVLQLCPIPLPPWLCINSPGDIYWSRRAVSPNTYLQHPKVPSE